MALLDQKKAPPPYIFQEFPKWLLDPNHPEPEDPELKDHSKGRTLVHNAEEEAAWYEKRGLMEPIIDEESAPEVEAARPSRKRR